MQRIKIECDRITDWNSFHIEFSEAFGFPDFYGKNMSAWVDCLTYLDDPDDTMTKIKLEKNEVLVIELLNAKAFKKRSPEIYEALLESSAFVNYRNLEVGTNPSIMLSFWN